MAVVEVGRRRRPLAVAHASRRRSVQTTPGSATTSYRETRRRPIGSAGVPVGTAPTPLPDADAAPDTSDPMPPCRSAPTPVGSAITPVRRSGSVVWRRLSSGASRPSPVVGIEERRSAEPGAVPMPSPAARSRSTRSSSANSSSIGRLRRRPQAADEPGRQRDGRDHHDEAGQPAAGGGHPVASRRRRQLVHAGPQRRRPRRAATSRPRRWRPRASRARRRSAFRNSRGSGGWMSRAERASDGLGGIDGGAVEAQGTGAASLGSLRCARGRRGSTRRRWPEPATRR